MNDWEAGTSGAVAEDFDVFLNHHGPDVKATFVAHLEDALRCAGFRPCLDARSLMKGNSALTSIDQALAMAKVHVAVVSRGYAESKYCLNELVAMMRSGKPVVPVFYDVEPGDLRWVENGPYAEAFEKHESKGRSQKRVQEWRDRRQKRVQEWRKALVVLAGLTGFRFADYQSDEAKLRREVVNDVARLTPSNERVQVEQYIVGLEGPTNRCIQMLDSMGARTGMLGILGMGGIGKTTLAKQIYNHFAAQNTFRSMTFLEIHRDPSTSDVQVRPKKLRKQLLWDLLRVQSSTTNDYGSWFKKVSNFGPVFIVIDDIHRLGQFEELLPFASNLHSGSRIIVTSRDRSVLNNVAGRIGVDHCLFDVATLDSHESNMLFNWHAFHAIEAPEEYKDVAKDVVMACGGLPLALKVIGSSLFYKGLDGDREAIWRKAVSALKQSRDVMDVLQWSYDNLQESEKHMFVDITCLFYNRPAEEALMYWESCENCMSCGGVLTRYTSLRNLIDKNLVVHDHDTSFLKVHDVLKDLGQGIGEKAQTHFVKNRAADMILMVNQGKEKAIALNLVGSRKRKFEMKDFANMPNLHYLLLPDGCSINGDFRFMPKALRWLQWRNVSFDHIPEGLKTSHLVSLDFSGSTNLTSLWTESCGSLKYQGCPNLLRLSLNDCISIRRLPESIGQSSRLQHLQLVGCEKLRKLPESIGGLTSLETLFLIGCSTLKALPTSIGQLKALEVLDVEGCTSLKALPDTIGALSKLKRIYSGRRASQLTIPPSIRLLSSIESLEIGGTSEWQTFSGGIGEAWKRLWCLKLFDCGGLGSLIDYGALQSLEYLDIDSRSLTELPESIGLLECLWKLRISCERLHSLPNSICDLKVLNELELSRCDNLKRLPKNLGALTELGRLIIECCPIRKLPRSIGLLSKSLNFLKMKGCKSMQKLPAFMRQLERLKVFIIEDCGSIEAMGALTTLQGLPIWGSTSITKIPASLGIVSTLVVLNDGHPLTIGCTAFDNCTSQILEEDDSGFLEAYEKESSGLTSLFRGVHKKQE